jgi:hypothetical protein
MDFGEENISPTEEEPTKEASLKPTIIGWNFTGLAFGMLPRGR